MKPFTFRKNKRMVGQKANEFIAIAKPRPDLHTSYIPSILYELPDGRIVGAVITLERPDGFHDNPDDYPVVDPYPVYQNEQELQATIQRIKEDMAAEGRQPIPHPAYKELNSSLSGKAATDFLQTHVQLDTRHYSTAANDPSSYFKDQTGGIIWGQLWSENPPSDLFKDHSDGPWILLAFRYESEANYREWQAYLEGIPKSTPAQPRPYADRFATLNEAETAAFLNTHEHMGSKVFRLPGFTEYFKGPDGKIYNGTWVNIRQTGTEADFSPDTQLILGRIYESEHHAREWELYLEASIRSVQDPRDHLLYRYTRNAPDWPTHLETWRSFLSEYLSIPLEQLDYSIDSCRIIDRHRNAQKIDLRTFNSVLFGPCLGYLYEVIRRHWKGEWYMKPSDWAPIVYEPYIRRSDGVEIRLFVNYWEDTNENYQRFSLYNMATDALSEAYPAFML